MTPSQHNRVKKIFSEARILPKNKIGAFIKKKARGDVEIENEVLAMLANDFEETILIRDISPRENTVIDPLGLNELEKGSRSSYLASVFFSTRGRAGLAFLFFAVLISVAGYYTAQKTKNLLAEIRGEETMAILNSNVQSLEYWISNYQRATELAISDPDIIENIAKLLEAGQDTPIAQKIDAQLKPFLYHAQAFQYVITDVSGTIICTPNMTLVGERVDPRFGDKIYAAASGTPQFFLPFYQQKNNPEATWRSLKPLVWMQIPVRDSLNNIIATFGIGRLAERDFTRILRTARMGQSGETYAIDNEGWFISESRFEDEMRANGKLDADTNHSSILTVSARKSEIKKGEDAVPFTDLANMLISSANDSQKKYSGKLTKPSEDYKGHEVIGAYTWLHKYEFGVISQIDAKEAFAPIKYLRLLVSIFVLLLVIASFYSFYNANKLQKISSALSSAAHLGQYELKNILAEGGMGTVYLAHHNLLKRPTAIKVVRVDKEDANLTKRFETEVKLASQLTHPNTIEIFDYGFTKHRQAYYAMEFINGINLSDEVKTKGAQPIGRVIHILRQVCGSLHEAHTLGLVHRDIKPQNIMLCSRIGLPDFVKVLDFGLAKPLGEHTKTEETHAITGTPIYIAPERLKKPALAEPAADIYSVGALAYFLLAGKPIFSFSSDLDIMYQILNDNPKPLPDFVPQELQKLIFFCLEKSPENRPTDINEVKLFLDVLAQQHPWKEEDATNYA